LTAANAVLIRGKKNPSLSRSVEGTFREKKKSISIPPVRKREQKPVVLFEVVAKGRVIPSRFSLIVGLQD